MDAILVLVLIVTSLAGLGAAAVSFGVDTRDSAADRANAAQRTQPTTQR